jgi:cytochrome oxidase Cu insertion factor (SCO1/SenC/PrrC family)
MSKNVRGGKRKVGFAFFLVFGPALLLVFIATRSCDHKFKQLGDYGQVINYSFTDANGVEHQAKEFENEVVLITTLQETCPDSCAISFWHLNQTIYEHVYANKRKKLKRVRLISFVTDGKGNPVEDVSAVAAMVKDRVKDYDPKVWMIAKGNPKEIYDLRNNKETLLREGDEYFGGQAFQELILLIDKQNHLRMVLSGKTEGMMRRMKEHLALLQKQYDKSK